MSISGLQRSVLAWHVHGSWMTSLVSGRHRYVPAVYVEHNAPRPHPADSIHPIAVRADIPIVDVTDFNRLMWDNGKAPTVIIEHGIADPGHGYVGDIPAAAAMINQPRRPLSGRSCRKSGKNVRAGEVRTGPISGGLGCADRLRLSLGKGTA